MNEYLICCDGVEGYEEYWYEGNAPIADAVCALDNLGGGHADIYDEDGDFVEDVEV